MFCKIPQQQACVLGQLYKKFSENKKGNALFLILLAVALFAALGFAVTRSRSGGGSIDRENRSLAISRVLEYNAYLSFKIQQMALSGTNPDDLDIVDGGTLGFTPCSSGVDCLFTKEGGGATYNPIAASLGAASLGFVEKGFGGVVSGAGTNPMILALYFDVPDNTCREINARIGIGSVIAADSVDGDTIVDAYPGEPQGCFKKQDGSENQYYYILLQ